jgi:hypothetical protein
MRFGLGGVNPVTDGVVRSFRGLRTGDKRSLYSGALLVAYGLWKRNRGRRELIYSREFRPGETILIRTSRADGRRIVVDTELAKQLKDR